MFITLEGIEGSGKTTQIKHILRFLRDCGHSVVATREPGGTPIGEKIRGILLDPDHKNLCAPAELLLYVADRVQHIHQVIRPALEAGRIVICDRFSDASIVYQGAARGMDAGLIGRLHRLAGADLRPDLTLLLDLPPEAGLARAWGRIGREENQDRESRFEEEDLAFHHRVRQGYLALAQREPGRFVVIDAGLPEAAVNKRIIATLESRLTAGKRTSPRAERNP